MVWDNTALVSIIQIFNLELLVDGNPVRVAGLSSFSTPPQHRSQGYGKLAINAAIIYAQDTLHCSYCFLFCIDSLVSWYESQGWKLVNDTVIYRQSDGEYTLSSPFNAMILECSSDTWQTGVVDIVGALF